MISKDLSRFAHDNWKCYKESLTAVSKSDTGDSLLESDFEVYNFDKICEMIFPEGNMPTSADGVYFWENEIRLIEFKSGFRQKITKNKFNPEIGKCDKTGEVCSYYWDLFWENQERKINELISSIRLKAIESYLLLEKKIIPICENDKEYKLIFTVVVDDDGVDGIEDTLAELSESDVDTNNSLIAIRNSLKRLTNQKDANGDSYLYDKIEVMTACEYANYIKTIT